MSQPADLDRFLKALPHGEPFRFVTHLTMLEPAVRGRGVWVVTGTEAFLAGHFPDDPIVPGVLIAESLAQLCGLIAFASEAGKIPDAKPARLAQVDVKIHTAIRPPAKIELAGTLVREMGNVLLFEVAATANGSTAADGRIVLSRSP